MVTMGASYIRTKGSIGYLWIALLIVGMLAMVVLIVHVNEPSAASPSSTPSVRSAARCTAPGIHLP